MCCFVFVPHYFAIPIAACLLILHTLLLPPMPFETQASCLVSHCCVIFPLPQPPSLPSVAISLLGQARSSFLLFLLPPRRPLWLASSRLPICANHHHVLRAPPVLNQPTNQLVGQQVVGSHYLWRAEKCKPNHLTASAVNTTRRPSNPGDPFNRLSPQAPVAQLESEVTQPLATGSLRPVDGK